MKNVFPYRRVLMLVAMMSAVLAGGLFSPGRAFACSSSCSNSAFIQYTFSAHGMAAQIVDEPISNAACDVNENYTCYFETYIRMQDSSGHYAEIGVVAQSGEGATCYSPFGGFQEDVVYDDYNNPIPTCIELPISDQGFVINVQLNDYFSNGGGMMFWANDGTNTFCTGSTCGFKGDSFTGNSERYSSSFFSEYFNSQKLTTATVVSYGNQYQTTGGTWTFLTTLQHNISAGNPPWIGWVSGNNPTQNPTGGEWYTCAANVSRNPC